MQSKETELQSQYIHPNSTVPKDSTVLQAQRYKEPGFHLNRDIEKTRLSLLLLLSAFSSKHGARKNIETEMKKMTI